MLAWLKELLRDKSMDPPPPRPVGWNKTLEDLDAEKRSLTGHEMHWAREYEREQLKAWARFPLDGEVYEATQDVDVTYMIYYSAPYGGGGKGVLPAGTKVKVRLNKIDPEPISVSADALEKERLKELLMPKQEYLASNYQDYGLFIKVARLNKEFKLVS